MKNNRWMFVFVVAFLSLDACHMTTVEKDMVRMDQVFIPVWYSAYIGDEIQTQIAMESLLYQWDYFERKHVFQYLTDEEWSEEINLIGDWLVDTDCAVLEGDLMRVTFNLEHVRCELMELRERLGVNDYYLDKIWELEQAISVVVITANDLQYELLTLDEFKGLAHDMELAWGLVLPEQIDANVFDWSGEEVRNFHYRKLLLHQEVQHLLDVAKTDDIATIAAAANELERVYLDFVQVFGIFNEPEIFANVER